MTRFRIFNLASSADVGDWLEMWNEWPHREVFAHPEYIRLYTAKHGRGLCAAWRSDAVQVLYPFILRDLAAEAFWDGPEGALFDIASPVGYAGPFAWGAGDRETLSQAFWAEFRAWALDHQVVSEFVRFSLFPGAILRYPGERWPAANQIIRSLQLEEHALWMDFDRKVRNNIDKAIRRGVAVEIDQQGARLSSFLRIYNHTPHQPRVPESLYFPREYFEQIHAGLRGQFAYFHAFLDGAPVSTELVLLSEQSVYSFLGGTVPEALDHHPNDLLKFEIMKWAKQSGKSHYILGGGHRGADRIYRRKRAFAPRGQVSYLLGGQVFSGALYAALVGARQRYGLERGEEWRPRQGFFPAYRG